MRRSSTHQSRRRRPEPELKDQLFSPIVDLIIVAAFVVGQLRDVRGRAFDLCLHFRLYLLHPHNDVFGCDTSVTVEVKI